MNGNLKRNPWISVWTSPRKTIEEISEKNPNYRLWVLSSIFGLSSLLGMAQAMALGNRFGLVSILIFSLLLAPFWGFSVLSISAWFFYQTGKWLKGSGNFLKIRTAMAWAHVPTVFTLVTWLLLLFLFRESLFQSTFTAQSFSSAITSILFFVALVQLTLSIWTLVIFLQGLSVVQHFSLAKASLNLLLTVLLIGAIFFILFVVMRSVCSPFFDVPLIVFIVP